MKTITVKGTGYVSASPDVIELRLSLDSRRPEYQAAIELENSRIVGLTDAIVSVGFEKRRLVTSSFNINTDYESRRNSDGEYVSVFLGYRVSHDLKLEFDLDMAKLSKTLGAIARCGAEPKLTIRFKVKDRAAVAEALLRSAAENARAKAEILASASGVSLGEIVSIGYDWAELNVYSRTKYLSTNDSIDMSCDCDVDIEPEDIEAEDTVTFVWQIA